MKRIIITLAFLSLLGIVFFALSGAYQGVNEHSEADALGTGDIKNTLGEVQASGYQVVIQSAVLSEKGTAFAHSDLSWKMYFYPNTDPSSISPALLTDIEFISDSKVQPMPQQLPFYFSYNGQQFTQSDLLGLPQAHPLWVLPKVLDLMSYSLSEPLTFKDALGKSTYRFQKSGNTISRVKIEQHRQQNQQEQESWGLTLKPSDHRVANQPNLQQLDYRNQQVLHQGTQQYEVIQTVTILPIEHMHTGQTNWDASHNKDIISPGQQAAVVEITGENFLKQLEQLADSLDPALAKAIGQFMLENYDYGTLKAYLKDHAGLSSALIYSLQKAQTLEAEQTLADLLTERDLSQSSLQKVAMALGRIENASNVAFASLQSVADDSAKQALADVALLSIGTMSKFSPQQSHQVARFLSRKLTEPQQLSTAILAVANSKNPALIEKLPDYLHHVDTQVRRNAIKSLAHNEAYQDQVIASLAGTSDVNAIDAFIRTYERADYALSNENIEKLTEFYQTTTHPIIKKRLATVIRL
ncbi:hypothetical protein [Pseudoalteromonas sp. R3]|uniref:hypothetical protein n=1 Tax=Pseudoalteromonas sp. R3 TaxID=1709477 RepID=UPI0006B66347|nr:hypothetical protein [Pseudoalteromonas sp. R3]